MTNWFCVAHTSPPSMSFYRSATCTPCVAGRLAGRRGRSMADQVNVSAGVVWRHEQQVTGHFRFRLSLSLSLSPSLPFECFAVAICRWGMVASCVYTGVLNKKSLNVVLARDSVDAAWSNIAAFCRNSVLFVSSCVTYKETRLHQKVSGQLADTSTHRRHIKSNLDGFVF